MSIEENKQLVKNFFEEVWNNGNLDYIDEVYTPDFTLHALWQNTSAGGAIEATGREPAKKVIGGWLAGFPDMTVTVDDQIAEGDLVGLAAHVDGDAHGGIPGDPADRQVRDDHGHDPDPRREREDRRGVDVLGRARDVRAARPRRRRPSRRAALRLARRDRLRA